MVIKQALRAATGWLELGMPEDALEELAGLPIEVQSELRVMELRLSAQMALEDWNSASRTALGLCDLAKDEPNFYVNAAFCLHEAGRTAEACDCLSKGPEILQEMPVFHYNMACYLWTLGDKGKAEKHLDIAVGMDETFRDAARTDKDLVGMKIC